jgi:hypothetical protein
MLYPHQFVGWLQSKLDYCDYHWTPLQILEIERQLPGLLDDLSIERWQRQIVESELKEQG